MKKTLSLIAVILSAAALMHSCKKPVDISAVTLNQTSITLAKGATSQLKATVTPDDASFKNVQWHSENITIATVSNAGLVKAVDTGTVNIVATSGSRKAVCAVTVSPTLTSGISLDKATLELKEGETYKLAATVTPADADDTRITWSSSAESVASVNVHGTVKAVGQGSATITAAVGSFTATCTVLVGIKPVSAIGVTVAPLVASVIQGRTVQLTASVLPSEATTKSVVWSSGNNEIATVAADGTVTGQGIGNTVIKATTTDGGFTAICALTVTAIPVESVSLDSESATLEKNMQRTLTATVLPANASDKRIVWASSNTSVATVADGVVSVQGSGTADITASAGGITATFRLTVPARDIYVFGNVQYEGDTYTRPTVWKNGKKLYELSDGTVNTWLHSGSVTASGDVYIAGSQVSPEDATRSIAILWKNNEILYSFANDYTANSKYATVTDVQICGNDIYTLHTIGKYVNYYLAVRKNGAATPLYTFGKDSGRDNYQNGKMVVTASGDVYVACSHGMNVMSSNATFNQMSVWKNGVKMFTTEPELASDMYAMTVYNSDVYVCTSKTNNVIFWKNSQQMKSIEAIRDSYGLDCWFYNWMGFIGGELYVSGYHRFKDNTSRAVIQKGYGDTEYLHLAATNTLSCAVATTYYDGEFFTVCSTKQGAYYYDHYLQLYRGDEALYKLCDYLSTVNCSSVCVVPEIE